MKNKKWLIAPIILVLASIVFGFFMMGYGYIAALCLFIAALLVIWHFAGKRLRVVIICVVAAGALVFTALEIPIIAAARTDAPAGCDYIIVLGAGVNGTVPSLSLSTRLEGALDYLEANPDTLAIVSGGQGAGEDITEAEAMRTWLEAAGVAPERIIEEDRATSTLENLSYSFDIIRARGDDTDNVCVVSSIYHLYRARQLAASLGVEITCVAAPIGYVLVTVNYFIREGFGRMYYMVFGME